jgi:hypothetical protein
MADDTEGLQEIANTADAARKADIVFVHGLGGDARKTWCYEGQTAAERFFWPAELGKDLPDCGIWALVYPAGMTVSFGEPGMRIEKRAGNLAQKLANAGVGDRPLVFVTHSMGGLAIKALVVGSQTLADQDRKRITRHTCGIVFCATPHRGSDYASAAVQLGKFLGMQVHLQEMQAGAEPLDILHDGFVEWQRQTSVPVCSYAENQGLLVSGFLGNSSRLGLVVPRASANPNIAGHTVRDVDEDHLSIVKPRSRKSDVYGGVLRFIKECLAREAPAAASSSASAAPVPVQAAAGVTAGGVSDTLATLARVTPNQRAIVRLVAKHRDGIHVTDLADALDIDRSGMVYRVRELVTQGLLQTAQLTDLLVELSAALKSLRAAAPADLSRALEDPA